MSRILLLFSFLLFSFTAFAQKDTLKTTLSAPATPDSTCVCMENRTGKQIFVTYAYQTNNSIKIDSTKASNFHTYGWIKIDVYSKKYYYVPAILPNTKVFYHALNAKDRTDNWGGNTFLMVHPSKPFWLYNADNGNNALSVNNLITINDYDDLVAYPFREMKYNPNLKCFFVILR